MRGKKMKHKIYLQFCLIAALAILITTTIVTALFYQRFKAQVFSDVRTYAYVLTSVDTYDEATLIQEVHQLDNLRVTIIDKEGKVLSVDKKNGKVVVEGVNMVSKHTKPNAQNQQGGIIKKENFIHASNVMYLHNGKATRLGAMIKDGKKVRVAKKTGEVID